MILYAGPSLSDNTRSLIKLKRISLKTPIKRGDLVQLGRLNYKGKVIIADGVFQSVLSVGHKEIMYSISNGMEIYGCSSMGAIRAYELRNFGMKGFGKVYEKFLTEDDFQDDELALLHEPVEPYRAVTEPLVHFRACIDHMVSENIISEGAGLSIIGELKDRWFGYRTVQMFKSLFKKYSEKHFENYFTDFSEFQVKKFDLINCIEAIY